MKGKPILYPISSPVEGMQVVWNNIISTLRYSPSNKMYIELGRSVELSELKQIVIEYDKYIPDSKFGSYYEQETLPLHPSDWKYALEHINEEVGFEEVHDLSPDFTKSPIFVHGAKLILPSPVTYTEEEVDKLVRNYLTDYGELDWSDWWDNNKKK